MKERLTKELSGLPHDFVVLTILPRERYQEMNMHMVKNLVTEKNNNGAYISINRPYQNLTKLMEKNGIDTRKLFFIDCVSEKTVKADNCVFMKSAESLTNIGISLQPSL